jgi:hypothetical protein
MVWERYLATLRGGRSAPPPPARRTHSPRTRRSRAHLTLIEGGKRDGVARTVTPSRWQQLVARGTAWLAGLSAERPTPADPRGGTGWNAHASS